MCQLPEARANHSIEVTKYNLIRFIITLFVATISRVRFLICVISARQIRAARALLGWSQQELGDKAIVSLNAVARLEKGVVDSRMSTVQAIEAALSKAGIEFLARGEKGEGVRLRSPDA